MALSYPCKRAPRGFFMISLSDERGLSMSDVNSLASQISEVKEDMREIRISMGKISEAITRLAVLESQNKEYSKRQDSLEERQSVVEKESAETKLTLIKATSQVSGAMNTIKILWMVVGTTAVTIMIKLFF